MLKIHRNQNGFSPAIVPLVIVMLAVVGFAIFRVVGSSNEQGATKEANNEPSKSQTVQVTKEQEKDIELQNFGIATLSDVVVTKDALREFKDKGLKGFYVFGDALPGGRQNPNFEFASLQPTTEVIAAIDGVVVNIKEQTEVGVTDNEVFIQPKEGSAWTVGYDHLVNIKVKRGDSVKAGDVLGNPAPQNNGAYRFELQINKDTASTTHICPSTIVAATVKEKLLGELKTMLEAWEQQTGFELYDIAAQKPIGCIQPTLTPTQAEGR